MVVDASDSYREAEALGAVLMAGLLAFIAQVLLEFYAVTMRNLDWNGLHFSGPELLLYGGSIWTFIPLVVVLFLPVRYLFRKYPVLKLPFAGNKRIVEAVRERAVRAFFEKRLYKTRDETGILIFISLLEHKVWILGDRGVNEKLPQATWQGLVEDLTGGIRKGKACEALCSVISSIGVELHRHFPIKSDDSNELSDELLH
jgi:putative membrane protein